MFATYRRDPRPLHDVYARHGLEPGERCFEADLTSYEQTAAAVEAVAAGGPLWAVVNLAGTAAARRLARMDADEARTILLDSALPALFATKSALETLPGNGLEGGRIVHVSSVTVRRPVPGAVPYIAGKAAVEGVVRAAAEEGGRGGITVNALRLGYFEAGMSAVVPPPCSRPSCPPPPHAGSAAPGTCSTPSRRCWARSRRS